MHSLSRLGLNSLAYQPKEFQSLYKNRKFILFFTRTFFQLSLICKLFFFFFLKSIVGSLGSNLIAILRYRSLSSVDTELGSYRSNILHLKSDSSMRRSCLSMHNFSFLHKSINVYTSPVNVYYIHDSVEMIVLK